MFFIHIPRESEDVQVKGLRFALCFRGVKFILFLKIKIRDMYPPPVPGGVTTKSTSGFYGFGVLSPRELGITSGGNYLVEYFTDGITTLFSN